ncbi:MAG: hypothetical protein GY749_24480 [Desulfobacteraceae bacterium]|nr:hypothetical protein [Desulfobacteraceae bacterium]
MEVPRNDGTFFLKNHLNIYRSESFDTKKKLLRTKQLFHKTGEKSTWNVEIWTHFNISFIDWHYCKKNADQKPCLITAPFSLIENWQAEYDSFFH